MSNTTMELQVFQKKAVEAALNPYLVIVDGAQGGRTAKLTANPQAPYWDVDDQRLAAAAVTGKQVQAVWIKQANAGPAEGFPDAAKLLQHDVVETLHNLHDHFPNLKIAALVRLERWTGERPRLSSFVSSVDCVEESADVLKVSPQTVMRDWRLRESGWPESSNPDHLRTPRARPGPS